LHGVFAASNVDFLSPTIQPTDGKVAMPDHIDDREKTLFRQGMEAWERLKKEESWEDWLKVGQAHIAGRALAMQRAGVTTNVPRGTGYKREFGKWLAEYKFDDIDKGDRSRLFAVMENLPAIEAWRKTLTQTERLKLNHPSTVLRKWKKETQIDPEDKPKRKIQREANIELDEENHGLKQHVQELEANAEQLRSEIEALKAKIAELKEQANQREKDVRQLEKITSHYIDKNAALLKELQEVKVDMKTLSQWEATRRA
jgi:vacuolar-type H+-ATPase subunit I/STV1